MSNFPLRLEKGGIVLDLKIPKSCSHIILAFTNSAGVEQICPRLFKSYEVRYEDIQALVKANDAKKVRALPLSEKEAICLLTDEKPAES